MGLRVNTNVQAIAALRHLEKNNVNFQKTVGKLASGNRIARAADDAAGLAVSESMRAQIRSINQAMRNANDGISMIQTAEGGMNEIANILIRFRELSIQSASDTIGNAERQFLDKEVQQLKSEIDRIAESTEFNGRKLLAEGGDLLEFQIGMRNNPGLDRFQFNTEKVAVTTEVLGVGDLSVGTKESAQENLNVIDDAIRVVSENRAEVGALQNRLQSSVNNLGTYNENLQAARSRIADADIAKQASELSKSQILAQAGTSVLGQANANASLALQLL